MARALLHHLNQWPLTCAAVCYHGLTSVAPPQHSVCSGTFMGSLPLREGHRCQDGQRSLSHPHPAAASRSSAPRNRLTCPGLASSPTASFASTSPRTRPTFPSPPLPHILAAYAWLTNSCAFPPSPQALNYPELDAPNTSPDHTPTFNYRRSRVPWREPHPRLNSNTPCGTGAASTASPPSSASGSYAPGAPFPSCYICDGCRAAVPAYPCPTTHGVASPTPALP